jgi:hypothetical protein
MHKNLFSFKWWVLLLIAIMFCFVWWKLVDKKRFSEIFLVGFVAATLTFVINDTGLEMTLWSYPIQLFGLVRGISEIELVILPTLYMLLYQRFGQWKKYIFALIVFAAISAFIVIPFAVWFGAYKLIKWRYIYSFMVFIAMGIIIKLIVSKVMDVQKRSI